MKTTFLGKQKLRGFITRRLTLQEMLRKFLKWNESNTRWKLGTTQRNEELWKCKDVNKHEIFFLFKKNFLSNCLKQK